MVSRVLLLCGSRWFGRSGRSGSPSVSTHGPASASNPCPLPCSSRICSRGIIAFNLLSSRLELFPQIHFPIVLDNHPPRREVSTQGLSASARVQLDLGLELVLASLVSFVLCATFSASPPTVITPRSAQPRLQPPLSSYSRSPRQVSINTVKMDEKKLREQIVNLKRAIDKKEPPSTIVTMLKALEREDAPTEDVLRVSLRRW